MPIRSIVSSAIKAKLFTIPALTTFVNDRGHTLLDDEGNLKYFLGIADGETGVPYIKVNHTYGGERPRSPRREFDQLWQICVVSDDQFEAETLYGVIYGTLVPFRLDYTEGWFSDNDITYNGDYFNNRIIQGIEYWEVGGYYRIRGVK